jgi:hypothetical protein
MKSIERRSFANLQEFREYAWNAARLVYYYVFDGTPNQRIIDSLAGCGPDEALVLLDVAEDRGLLRQTDVTVDITPDREFVTRKMAEYPGLGAWAKGTSVRFVTDPSDVPSLVEYSRRFALPSQKSSEAAGPEGS